MRLVGHSLIWLDIELQAPLLMVSLATIKSFHAISLLETTQLKWTQRITNCGCFWIFKKVNRRFVNHLWLAWQQTRFIEFWQTTIGLYQKVTSNNGIDNFIERVLFFQKMFEKPRHTSWISPTCLGRNYQNNDIFHEGIWRRKNLWRKLKRKL